MTLNVAFKAAGRAFLVNGGPKTNVTRNLIVNSGIGLYNEKIEELFGIAPVGTQVRLI